MNSSDSTESSPRIGIGVDFGTSNSAAAVYDGEQIHLIPFEETAVVMPSATYIDKELKITTGQAAINRYVDSNMGRTVELSAEVLGEGRSTTGQIGDKGLPEEAQTELIYGKASIRSKTERGLCPFQMPQTANNGVKLRQSVIAAGAISDRVRISSRHFSETLDPALQSLIKDTRVQIRSVSAFTGNL